MKAFLGTIALALAAGCGGGATVAGGTPPTPAPASRHLTPIAFAPGGPWRYRYDRIDSIMTTLPNGGTQLQVVERHLQLHWTNTRGPEGLLAQVTIDSADIVGMPGGLDRTLEDSARGSLLRFGLTTDGRVSSPQATPDNTVARAFGAQLPWIIPALPPSLMVGAARTDTVTDVIQFGAVDLTERTLRQTTIGSALGTFDLVGTITREGTSPQLHLTGAGQRIGRAEFAPGGALRLATGRDSVAMTALVAAMGQEVGLSQISAYTLAALP